MNHSLKNSIIYNVYPTSFLDTNGDGVGDLKGITDKLEYISQLADIVWINPIFASPFRDGGYDVSDYYKIDKRFGTMDDLKALLSRAKQLKLKVILDLVVGHTSDTHRWFKQSRKPERNKYSDYYVWNDDVFGECPYRAISGNTSRNGNYLINFFCFQPALNFGFAKKKYDWQFAYTDEPCLQIRREVEKIIMFYLEMGVDGFRVDMASSIVKDDVDGKCSCEVWRDIFGNVRQKFPSAIFVSEWGQPEYAVGNGDFDIDFLTHGYSEGYNNLFRKERGTNVLKGDGHSFFRREGLGEAHTFFDYFLHHLKAIDGKGYMSVVTGNHDLPRVAFKRGNDELKLVLALVLVLPCVPLIYYGDELGMDYNPSIVTKDGGYCRTGSRTPMQWNGGKNAGFSTTDGDTYLPLNSDYRLKNVESESADDSSPLSSARKLVALRRAHGELLSADAKFELISSDYPLVIKRRGEKGEFICLINPSDREYVVEVGGGYEMLSAQSAEYSGESVKLGAVSYAWLIRGGD